MRDIVALLRDGAPPIPCIGGDDGEPTAEARAAALDRFQTLLTLGQRGEACQVAVDARLWDHALIIASRLGGERFNEVVGRFSREMLRRGHPTQFLYKCVWGSGWVFDHRLLWAGV